MWFSTNWLVLSILLPLSFQINLEQAIRLERLSIRYLFFCALIFYILWAGSNYLYTSALSFTSASVVTAVFSSAPVFVFILSYVILKEIFTLLKLLAVILSISGVALIAYSQGFHNISFYGVCFATISALLAAVYKVNLKKALGDTSMSNTAIYLALVGAINMFIFWPLIIILYVLGIEDVSQVPWANLVLQSLASFLFNSFINYGIIYTSPLFISIGTILGIPLSILTDYVINPAGQVTILQICGSGCVALGFILLILTGTDSEPNSIYQEYSLEDD